MDAFSPSSSTLLIYLYLLRPIIYLQAVSQAFQASKFLLVYLHSPLHEDSNRFCAGVMCSQNFKNFADENVLVWSGQVWDPEAYWLSMQLRSTTFPFMALLLCETESYFQIADKVQGYVDDRQVRMDRDLKYTTLHLHTFSKPLFLFVF